jgi:hypothetical protein
MMLPRFAPRSPSFGIAAFRHFDTSVGMRENGSYHDPPGGISTIIILEMESRCSSVQCSMLFETPPGGQTPPPEATSSSARSTRERLWRQH